MEENEGSKELERQAEGGHADRGRWTVGLQRIDQYLNICMEPIVSTKIIPGTIYPPMDSISFKLS